MQTGGILSGKAILESVKNGDITVSPFNESNINQGSLDLTLGEEVSVYESWVEAYSRNYMRTKGSVEDGRYFVPLNNVLDVKQEPRIKTFKMDSEVGWVLMPGIGYLMHTRERICTNKYVPIVDGKSSLGRLFTLVHFTAGYGETGFDGQYTLEVSVMHPMRVYPGMRCCQIRFHTIIGETEDYKLRGNYKGSLAEGPVASQAYKMFQK